MEGGGWVSRGVQLLFLLWRPRLFGFGLRHRLTVHDGIDVLCTVNTPCL